MKGNSKKSVLITSNGDRITISYPKERAEEVLEEMCRTMETGECWSIADHLNTTAHYKGEQLFLVNMGVVIGVGG